PSLLTQLGIGLEQVRAGLRSVNANAPKGQLTDAATSWTIQATDQLFDADEYRPVIVAWQNGAPVRLGDIASVESSVEDLRTAGLANGKRAVLLGVFRQPGTNIIETVDRVTALMPELRASISPAIDISVVLDRTTTIRASFRDIQLTLLLSIALVVLVVFLFLRKGSATTIPSVAVPLSLLGTFGGMYLLGYSLDNLSLMALTIATGFVVDDAIVVLENITRYVEEGVSPREAALRGAKEVGFTVLSMSASLVAVFIPILMMGGLVGRLFREFAVTLSVAIGVSLLVSLSTTPMMCAQILKPLHEVKHGRAYRASQAFFDWMLRTYRVSLGWVLRHQTVTLLVTIATAGLTVYLYAAVPKGFFPQQDTGRVMGSVQADQDISFTAMREKMQQFVNIVMRDQNVQTVVAFAGGNTAKNQGRMFILLRRRGQERKLAADQSIDERWPK